MSPTGAFNSYNSSHWISSNSSTIVSVPRNWLPQRSLFCWVVTVASCVSLNGGREKGQCFFLWLHFFGKSKERPDFSDCEAFSLLEAVPTYDVFTGNKGKPKSRESKLFWNNYFFIYHFNWKWNSRWAVSFTLSNIYTKP